MFVEQFLRPCGPIDQFTAAIGATVVEHLGAFCAKGAFKRTNERTSKMSW
jgi:hypothetical protein